MTCRFCNEEKSLVRSHIIPRSFFPKTIDGEGPLQLLTNKDGEYSKKAPIGIYDKNILCLACEKNFDSPDNYAHELLIKHRSRLTEIIHERSVIAYNIPEYDYSTLKRFFISILWRASVSTNSFYNRIRLGMFENTALECLKSSNEIPAESFSVILSRYDHPLGTVMLDPHPSKVEGINFNRFYLGGYIAHIKTDNRKTPTPMSEIMMHPGTPLTIIAKNLETSKEFAVMKKIVHSATKLDKKNELISS